VRVEEMNLAATVNAVNMGADASSVFQMAVALALLNAPPCNNNLGGITDSYYVQC
jgi:hypothetical protein